MYKNQHFDEFVEQQKSIKSTTIDTLTNQIKNFYNSYNSKKKRYTSRYCTTVEAILNQFPINIRNEIDGKKSFISSSGLITTENEIEETLENYIKKFESINYLEFLSEENRNVVFVGPNGCGKTTLLRKLKKDTQGAKIYYYPADRVLLVREHFNPKRSYDAFIKDLNETYQHAIDIDYSLQGTNIIEQFDYFINLLERERYEENEKDIKNGKTQRIIEKWGELVKDRELFFEHGLRVRPINGTPYPLKYLSSGEKSILYFLIGILLQEKKDFYFIDEPENNLNPAIVSKLWDFIEKEMKGSVFVYLTHDSEFVASRTNAKIYWIEKYNGIEWKWTKLTENKDLPKELSIQLVGSREPVIFCESKDEYKLDSKIFKKMFPEFKVVSASGCAQVETYVKAYKTLENPQKVYGIIDCDYKEQSYLTSLESNNIYHLPFLEIENFLFSEKIIKKMIKNYSQDEDKTSVFNNLHNAIKNLFIERKDTWIAKHVAFDLRDKFDYRGKINSLKDLTSFKKLYNSERISEAEIDKIADKYNELYQSIIDDNNYNLILRHLDYKGILTKFAPMIKLKNEESYEELVFDFLNTTEGEELLKDLRNEYFQDIIS